MTLEIKDILTSHSIELAVLGNKLLDKVCAPWEYMVGTNPLLKSFATLRLPNSLLMVISLRLERACVVVWR
jgi:hypothetical protein